MIEDIDISIRNGNEYDATGGEFVAVDDWVSYAINPESGLGEITVTPNSAVMAAYANTKLRLDILGHDPLGGADKVDSFSFMVGDLVESEC